MLTVEHFYQNITLCLSSDITIVVVGDWDFIAFCAGLFRSLDHKWVSLLAACRYWETAAVFLTYTVLRVMYDVTEVVSVQIIEQTRTHQLYSGVSSRVHVLETEKSAIQHQLNQ